MIRGTGLPQTNDTNNSPPAPRRKRVLIDTVARYLALSITMVVSFLLLPFLIRHIGKPAYGLQALAHQTLEFVTILALAVGMSHDRIATGYYAQGDYDRMNAVLAAGLRLAILVALAIALATGLIVAFAHVLFDLPVALLRPARWVLIIFGVGAVVQIVSSVYKSPIYITQRLYLHSIGRLTSVLVPAVVVIPLFLYWRASIVAWVALSVAMRIVSLWTIVIPFGRRGVSHLKIRIFKPDAGREMRALAHFGGMTVIGSLGSLLYFATDSIMVSNLNELGIHEVVNYNVAQRWYPQIEMLASQFVLMLGPAMVASFALNQLDQVRKVVARATRYAYIILAAPCLLLLVQAEPFLRLWLGPAFAPESVPVMRVIMGSLLLSGAGVVAREALYASRQVRGVVVVTLLGGTLNVILSITLVKVAGMGLLGIATGSLVSLFILQVLCLPHFLCKHLTLHRRVLWDAAARALMGAVPLIAAILVVKHLWIPASLGALVIQFAVCGLAYLPGIWFLSLTDEDRHDVRKGLAAARAYWQERRSPIEQ